MKRLAALFVGVIALVWAQGALAAIVVTKLGTVGATASATTAVITTSAAVAAGDMEICIVGLINGDFSPTVISSASDGTNSMSAVTGTLETSSSTYINMVAKYNASAVSSGATITITFLNSQGNRMVGCYTVSGLTTTPADQSNIAQNAGSTTPSVATGTLAQAAEVVFGAVNVDGSSTYTEASGFSTLDAMAAGGIGTVHTAYEIVAATTAVTYAPTLGTSREWSANIASFKGAAAAAAPPTRALLGVGK